MTTAAEHAECHADEDVIGRPAGRSWALRELPGGFGRVAGVAGAAAELAAAVRDRRDPWSALAGAAARPVDSVLACVLAVEALHAWHERYGPGRSPDEAKLAAAFLRGVVDVYRAASDCAAARPTPALHAGPRN